MFSFATLAYIVDLGECELVHMKEDQHTSNSPPGIVRMASKSNEGHHPNTNHI
jgi:hypothetical protein